MDSSSHSDFDSAGRALLAQFTRDVRKRLATRYPGAPEELVVHAAEGAIRMARRYDDCAELTDETLDKAMRTAIRHTVLPYDSIFQAFGGRVDNNLYTIIKAAFCYLANLVADELATPRAVTVCKPRRRRFWPPQVGQGWGQ